MSSSPELLVCLTTVAGEQQARDLAEQLLGERLAACVQIDAAIESFFRWEGKTCRETEYRLVIKTTAGLKRRLAESLRRWHPYDVPQIVMLPCVGSDPDYAAWVGEQTVEGDQN